MTPKKWLETRPLKNLSGVSKISIFLIGMVWLINGLICKCLNLVPRHQLIVERILGEEYASHLTFAIGVGEIAIAAWVWSKISFRLCCNFQIVLIMTMNVLELVLAPDLLLFGRLNIVWAAAFSTIIWMTEKNSRTAEIQNSL